MRICKGLAQHESAAPIVVKCCSCPCPGRRRRLLALLQGGAPAVPLAAAVKGAALYTCGYAVPSRPGHCLLFSTSYAVADGSALQRLLLRLLPRWALHLYTQVGRQCANAVALALLWLWRLPALAAKVGMLYSTLSAAEQ